MKQETHPEYGTTTFQCACGNVIETRSTVQGVVQVEICSSCHPFFTGKQKLLDSAGRIDRFKKKFGEKLALGSQKRKKPSSTPAKPAPKKNMEAGGFTNPLKEKFQKGKK